MPPHKPELGPCHVWLGSTDGGGYGLIGTGSAYDGTRRNEKTHRVAFLLAHGRWPEPFGLHRCDNRRCVKAVADEHGPAHLFEGTRSDNMRDMVAKGRQNFQLRPGSRARGDRHYSRTKPHRLPRGERNGQSKVTAGQVDEMRRLAAAGEQHTVLATRFAITPSAVGYIVRGKHWAHTLETDNGKK